MATSKDYSDDEDDNWLKDVQNSTLAVYIGTIFTLICPNEEHHSCTFAIQMLQRFLKNVFHISANDS
jgi:two-component SAPR family response regulator